MIEHEIQEGLRSDGESAETDTSKSKWELTGSLVVLLAVLAIVGFWSAREWAKRIRIENANQEVRKAVEEAQKWTLYGKFSDADQVEKALRAAKANPWATETDSVGVALMAFQKNKCAREVARRKVAGVLTH